MKRVLVTGAGGFIGRTLTQSLADEGVYTVAVDNNYRGSLDEIEGHELIEKHVCDVLDADRIMKLLQGVDVVYHLAAINGTGNFYKIPEKVLEIGIIGTHNVLKACIASRVKWFTFVSSSEVYHHPGVIPTPENIECRVPDVFNPRFSYGGGKIAGELMTIHYLNGTGIQYTIIRPHNVYGPNMGMDHVIPQMIEKFHRLVKPGGSVKKVRIEIQGTGDETRSFIFITDAVRAIELCTFRNPQTGIFHIGTQEEVRIRDLVHWIGGELGVQVELAPTLAREGGTARRCPDTEKIGKMGFVPHVSLKEGLAQTVNWYWNYYNRKQNKKG